jgi:hypothetical protein
MHTLLSFVSEFSRWSNKIRLSATVSETDYVFCFNTGFVELKNEFLWIYFVGGRHLINYSGHLKKKLELQQYLGY